MTKKARRSRRKRRAAQPSVARASKQQPVPVERASALAKVPAAAKVDLSQEYYYVFSDLRRIAIIAAVMFALLFTMAFLLR
jgi:hypothetical protein